MGRMSRQSTKTADDRPETRKKLKREKEEEDPATSIAVGTDVAGLPLWAKSLTVASLK